MRAVYECRVFHRTGACSGKSSSVAPCRVAKAIVCWREQHGAFESRQQLLKVTHMKPKTFEQSVDFLHIRGGDNSLNGTGNFRHPPRDAQAPSAMAAAFAKLRGTNQG